MQIVELLDRRRPEVDYFAVKARAAEILQSPLDSKGTNADQAFLIVSMWRCQFENAIVGLKRTVLDLNPGSRHAAGKRA